MSHWIFWGSLGLLVYTYFGYPFLLWLLTRRPVALPSPPTTWPLVSLVIPAYNEADIIAAKLVNSLAIDYPRDRLEIVVLNDGSTDGTPELVRRFAAQGIQLRSFRERMGKARLLNATVPFVRGELVVISDASCFVEPAALQRLAHHFSRPEVGCVSGAYRLGRRDGSSRSAGEGLYWRYEVSLKRRESRIHSILGAHGALYAIRRSLYQTLPVSAINDDYLIPMRIVAAGYRALYDDTAVSWEQTVATTEGEFARRVRITVGNYQQMWLLRSLLHPRRGWIALQFCSHKVLRTLTPIFLLSILFANVVLAFPAGSSGVFQLSLLLQGLFYATAAIGVIAQRRRWPTSRVLTVPFYFCLTNAAALLGLLRFLLGRQPVAWKKVSSV